MARFVLRHKRPSPWRLVLPVSLALILGGSIAMNGGAEEWPVLMLLVLGAILLPFVIFGLLSRPMPDQWMEVRQRSLVLPATSFSSEPIEIPIAQVRSIYARLTRNGSVWIETTYRTFTFPLGAFESPQSAALLVDRVRECIRALPGGDQRIAAIDRDARIAERALSTKHPATISAITILVVASLLHYLGGVQDLTVGVVRFGANVGFLVRAGEVHRLIASLFLHPTLIHLVFVVFGISTAGAMVERLLGSIGAVLIMLLSGLAGSIAMQAGDTLVIAGASPVVFGLMGAAAFTTQHHRDRIPMLLRPTLGLWILIATFTLPIALIPEVDFSANMGGLLAGVVASALVGGDEQGLPIRGLRPRWAVVLAGVLAGLYLAGIVLAVIAWKNHTRDTDFVVMERVVELDRSGIEELNRIAWRYAIDPQSTPRELELAALAATRAVYRANAEAVHSVKDTLATVRYRQGRFDEAIALEKEVFAKEPIEFFASQLARFMHASARTATVTAGARIRDGYVEVSLREPLSGDGAAYSIAFEGDRLLGLVTFPLRAETATSSIPLRERVESFEGAELRVVTIDPNKTIGSRAFPFSAEAARLP